MKKRCFVLALLLAYPWTSRAEAQFFFKRNTVPAKAPEQRLQELIVQVKSDPDERKRSSAAEALREFDARTHPEIVTVLADVALADPRSGVRSDAITSLSRIRPVSPVAGQAIEKAAANDESFGVRMQAKSAYLRYQWAGYSPGKTPEPAKAPAQTNEPPLAAAPQVSQTPPNYQKTPATALAPQSTPYPPNYNPPRFGMPQTAPGTAVARPPYSPYGQIPVVSNRMPTGPANPQLQPQAQAPIVASPVVPTIPATPVSQSKVIVAQPELNSEPTLTFKPVQPPAINNVPVNVTPTVPALNEPPVSSPPPLIEIPPVTNPSASPALPNPNPAPPVSTEAPPLLVPPTEPSRPVNTIPTTPTPRF